MASTTGFDLKKYIVETYKLGRYWLNDASQSDTTTIGDASKFAGHRGDEKIEVGCDILIQQSLTPGDISTAIYDVTRVSLRPSDTAGQITLKPTPSVGSYETPVVASNDTEGIVYFLPFRDEDFDHIIDEVLGEDFMWQKLIRPLTSIVDGDMRASAETDWTLSSATDAKAAATFPFGERVIVVTDDGSGGGYTSTGNLAVEEKETYYLEVTGYGKDDADAGSLVAYDATNGAAITLTNSVIDRLEPEILVNPSVQMPASCEQVDIRLTSTNTNDVVSWANLIWRKNEQMIFTLQDKPYRILDIGQVRSTTENTWGRRTFENMAHVNREVVQIGDGLWQIQLKESVSGRAVFYEEWVAPGALGSNSATTIAPKEAVAAVVAERLLQPHAEDKEWKMLYVKAATKAAQVISKAQSQRSYVDKGQRIQVMQRV